MLRPLLAKLLAQIGKREDVELLSLMDNKSLHIYEKPNELLRIARGTHLAWLDDDDDVSDDYVAKITEAIEHNPAADVISFNQICYLDGKQARVFARMGNPQEDVVPDPRDPARFKDTLRRPWHWCVWKTSLAQSEKFRATFVRGSSGQMCEDIDWLDRL